MRLIMQMFALLRLRCVGVYSKLFLRSLEVSGRGFLVYQAPGQSFISFNNGENKIAEAMSDLKLIRLLLVCALVLSGSTISLRTQKFHADTLHLGAFFERGIATVDPVFPDNGVRMAENVIRASASPEGLPAQFLALRGGEHVNSIYTYYLVENPTDDFNLRPIRKRE